MTTAAARDSPVRFLRWHARVEERPARDLTTFAAGYAAAFGPPRA